MTLKKMTLEEFKEAYNGCGESVMEMAHIAAKTVTDDDELVIFAKAALRAEDEFLAALDDRDIQP